MATGAVVGAGPATVDAAGLGAVVETGGGAEVVDGTEVDGGCSTCH